VTPQDRRGWRRFLIAIGVVGVIGLSFVGGSPIYLAKGVHGRVVDAETGRPLAGVVVVARWPKYGGLLHPTTLGYFALQEAVSDADGRYAIPGWGPRLRGRGTPERDRPRLWFFKAGYVNFTPNNVFRGSPWDVVLRSDWDGKTVELQRRRDSVRSVEGWDPTVRDFDGYLDMLEMRGIDVRKVLPKAVAALQQAKSAPPPNELGETSEGPEQ
jgi:hypothetical protein